jgi:hypothetical protein
VHSRRLRKIAPVCIGDFLYNLRQVLTPTGLLIAIGMSRSALHTATLSQHA